MLTQGTNVYTWDAANRLVSADVDGVVSTYAYNGLGQRTSQTVGGVTTEYVLDVAAGLPEVIVATTGGSSTYYVQIQSQILAQYGSGAWAYILPDHLGSVRQLTNAGGQVTLAQSYDPFGNLFEAAGLGQSPFGYTGEWWNAGAELLYLRARYYGPGMGRFITQDPFPGFDQRPATLHSYAYVTNNPINGTDASGYQGGSVAGTAGGGTIAVCFGVAFAIPEPFFIEEGICTLIALGLVAYAVITPIVVDDDLEVIPPPFPLGSSSEGWQESIPLDPPPDPYYIPGPTLDTPEWKSVFPGPPMEVPEPETRVIDFPLVQPCGDNILTADPRSSREIRKSIRSLEKQITKHQEKIEKRIGFDPVSDDPIRNQLAAEARLKHLQHEIENFRRQIEQLKQELISRGEIP